jgi:hypothetical protein
MITECTLSTSRTADSDYTAAAAGPVCLELGGTDHSICGFCTSQFEYDDPFDGCPPNLVLEDITAQGNWNLKTNNGGDNAATFECTIL